MKLFLYDDKHGQIIAELPINPKDKEAIEKVIQFLEEHDILNRYKSLMVANKAVVEYSDDFPYVAFY